VKKLSEKGKLFKKLCFVNILRDYGEKTTKVFKITILPTRKKDAYIIFEHIDNKVINFNTAEKLFEVSFDEYLTKVSLLHKQKHKESENGFTILLCHQRKHISMDYGFHIAKTIFILLFGPANAILVN